MEDRPDQPGPEPIASPESEALLLEAYLDGALDAEARAVFEARIEADPRLRAAVERQRAIGVTLRAALGAGFAAPDDRAVHAMLAGVIRQHREQDGRTGGEGVNDRNGHPASGFHKGTGRSGLGMSTPDVSREAPMSLTARSTRVSFRSLAMAAGVMILLAGGVVIWQREALLGRKPYVPPSVVSAVTSGPRAMPLDELYREQVALNMTPGWVCKDNEEFGSYFASRLGEKVWLDHSAADGAQWLGVSFTGGVSERTMGVLARVEGKDVVVFADLASARPTQPLVKDPTSGLHLHERRLGSLVLYEVSPLDKPRLLNAFYLPN